MSAATSQLEVFFSPISEVCANSQILFVFLNLFLLQRGVRGLATLCKRGCQGDEWDPCCPTILALCPEAGPGAVAEPDLRDRVGGQDRGHQPAAVRLLPPGRAHHQPPRPVQGAGLHPWRGQKGAELHQEKLVTVSIYWIGLLILESIKNLARL